MNIDYWDKVWHDNNYKDYKKYINLEQSYEFISMFHDNAIKSICDIACGFGKYSVISAYNGFDIWGTDISAFVIKITVDMLDSFGLNYNQYNICQITNISFDENSFDGLIAHAVLDHITYSQAEKAMKELSRIVKHNGLMYLSFDGMSTEDEMHLHETLEDGTMMYIDGEREGMMFRFYTDQDIEKILEAFSIEHISKKCNGEREVIIRNIK